MSGKIFLAFIATLAFAGPVGADSLDDELMIEAETATADSEAAIQEAKEADKVATEEKRRSQVEVSKAGRELERARAEEAKAKRDIVRAEADRVKAIEQTERAKAEAEQARQKTLMAKDELNDVMLKLDESKAEKNRAEEEKQKVVSALNEINKELKDMQAKLESAKKQELIQVKELGRAEVALKDLQDKAAISYKTTDKDTSVFLTALASHRDNLRKISKKLDELEVDVETDKSFYDKERRTRLTRELGSTIATTNGKIAKVITDGCNVRNNPSLDSEVLTKSPRGASVKVKKYNKGWFTTIHNGQKAFMGAGCFQ